MKADKKCSELLKTQFLQGLYVSSPIPNDFLLEKVEWYFFLQPNFNIFQAIFFVNSFEEKFRSRNDKLNET